MFSDFLLMAAKAELTVAKEAAAYQANRAHFFIATALQLCEYFSTYERMASFQMTTLLKVEDGLEGGVRAVRQLQHLKIVAPGCPELQSQEDKSQFFFTCIPFWMLGDGSYTVRRDDLKLQRLLNAEQGSDDKRVQAYAMALDMDDAFQRVRQYHDLSSTC
jgi:hypothetical protein